MTTKETSAYIKGLVDGSGLDTTTPEGKIIAARDAGRMMEKGERSLKSLRRKSRSRIQKWFST